MAILRKRLTVPMLATSAQLERLPAGCTVAVAGMVIARQRPGTAKGTMFLLFEDEWGTINLIVPKAVYERHRHLARAEPLLLARGRLERSEGVLNVLVRELAALEDHLSTAIDSDEGTAAASVSSLPSSQAPAHVAEPQPAWQSFVQGGVLPLLRQHAALHIAFRHERWLERDHELYGYAAQLHVQRNKWARSGQTVSILIEFGADEFAPL